MEDTYRRPAYNREYFHLSFYDLQPPVLELRYKRGRSAVHAMVVGSGVAVSLVPV